MARRIPTLVVLSLLLAACATTQPGPVVDSSAVGDAVYLEGISTRFSVRLDELRSSLRGNRNSKMPNAVVAGDQTVTVAAALFRCDDVYTLDLVINNLGDKTVHVDRSRIELFDDRGDRLNVMLDWQNGERFGLRAETSPFRGYRHLGTDFQAGQTGAKAEQARSASQSKLPERTHQTVGDLNALKSDDLPQDFSWLSALKLEEQTITLPDQLPVEPKSNTPYWVYWRGARVQPPLTAIVVIDGKRMLFRFDETGNLAR